MTNFNEVLKGFLWGLGFTISTALIYTGYGMYVQAALEFSYKEKLNSLVAEQVVIEAKDFESKIIGFRKTKSGFIIASRTKAIRGIVGAKYRIKFNLMASGEFAGTCYQDLDMEQTEKEYSFYQTSCNNLYLDSDMRNVTDISVSIIRK
jgi:hypothetical protein